MFWLYSGHKFLIICIHVCRCVSKLEEIRVTESCKTVKRNTCVKLFYYYKTFNEKVKCIILVETIVYLKIL